LNFLAMQCALLLVFWFIAWLAAMIEHRPWVERNPQVSYLWWMSATMFGLFLVFSLKNGGGEPNWPVMAYISGLMLTVARLREQLQLRGVRTRRFILGCLSVVCAVGLTLTVLVHHSEWVLPWAAQVAKPFTGGHHLPVRRIDPTCRLRGWRNTLAATVDRLREEIRSSSGEEPVVAGAGWTLPGELAFYCVGHPDVYSLGLQLGDRHSQYDFWRPNPVDDPEQFRGRTFIVVGSIPSLLAKAFETLDPPHDVPHFERGQQVSCWTITVGHGFRGFPSRPSQAAH
jgi:hypothetical protein